MKNTSILPIFLFFTYSLSHTMDLESQTDDSIIELEEKQYCHKKPHSKR